MLELNISAPRRRANVHTYVRYSHSCKADFMSGGGADSRHHCSRRSFNLITKKTFSSHVCADPRPKKVIKCLMFATSEFIPQICFKHFAHDSDSKNTSSERTHFFSEGLQNALRKRVSCLNKPTDSKLHVQE